MSQAPAFNVIAQGGRTCVREAEYSSRAGRYMTVTGRADRADRAAVTFHCSDVAMGTTVHLSIAEARALAAELLASADAVTHAGRA